MRATWIRTLAVTSLVVGGFACGDDDEVVVPSAAELAEHLIDVDTFGGEWTLSAPDDMVEEAETGIVTDETRDMLPGLDMCDEAPEASRAAADDIEWMAFRQINLDVDDAIEPPDDLVGNLVMAQEFLTADEPDQTEELFNLLRDGMQACFGEIPAGEEGPGAAEELDLPRLGEDRFGALIVLEEQGGWAEWRLYGGLIRDGAILTMIQIGDIHADVEPYYSSDEIDEMFTTAYELLQQDS